MVTDRVERILNDKMVGKLWRKSNEDWNTIFVFSNFIYFSLFFVPNQKQKGNNKIFVNNLFFLNFIPREMLIYNQLLLKPNSQKAQY